MNQCKSCSAVLGRRNQSGFCRNCYSQNVPVSEETKRKISKGIQRRIQADPEFKKNLQERGRRAANSPATAAARKERWLREKVWEQGNQAARKPDVRKRAGRSTTATRLAWCPPHLRQAYLDLIYKQRIKGEEARRMILEQDRAEVERLRNRMGYREPEPVSQEPKNKGGRPSHWPDCPPHLLKQYKTLQKKGIRAVDARRLLEKAA